MLVTIQPSVLSGTVHAPASKSSMQRACAAALLTNGSTTILNPGHSNDDKAALRVINAMGANFEINHGVLQVNSKGSNGQVFADNGNEVEINCGESGLGIRMFAPIVALSKKPININGEGSLLNRPMDFFDEVLPRLGVKVESKNGKLPLKIKGPLRPANIQIDGSLSSQFLTGLLMAFSAAAANDVSITVKNLKSKPYIDLTLQVMKDFGMNVPENRNYEVFHFMANRNHEAQIKKIHYTVEGDWSGGAFLLVAGAIAGNISVIGLDTFSSQADKAILRALIDCGAKLTIEEKRIEIGPSRLKSFHFDATDCPDLFPPLVALASCCEGKTMIKGTLRLTHKESNRAITLQQEFGKMGVQIDLQDDLMIVNGSGKLNGTTIHSHHDHRIAMAGTVAALKANGQTVVEEADAVNKSYPDFYEHIQALGGILTLRNSTLNVS